MRKLFHASIALFGVRELSSIVSVTRFKLHSLWTESPGVGSPDIRPRIRRASFPISLLRRLSTTKQIIVKKVREVREDFVVS